MTVGCALFFPLGRGVGLSPITRRDSYDSTARPVYDSLSRPMATLHSLTCVRNPQPNLCTIDRARSAPAMVYLCACSEHYYRVPTGRHLSKVSPVPGQNIPDREH